MHTRWSLTPSHRRRRDAPRTDAETRAHGPRPIPAGHRRRPGPWALALVLLAAWALSGLAAAGLQVVPADASILSKSPRDVVTSVFRVRNRTGAAMELEPSLVLPAGWRAITPGFPFRIAPGGTSVQLVSFAVPAGAPAGDYRVVYRVVERQRPGRAAQSGLRVRVLPVWGLAAEVVSLPRIAIAGESFTARYQVINGSNAPLAVRYGVDSHLGNQVEPGRGTLTLAPGASAPLDVEVRTQEGGKRLRERITLHLEAPAAGLSDQVERGVEIVPRVSAGVAEGISIPTLYSVSAVGRLRDGVSDSGMQIAWGGSGPIDASGRRHLAFLMRGPGLTEESQLGLREEVWLDYQGPGLDLTLGDRSYGLSPLSEQGRWGRGAGLRLRRGPWDWALYHMRERLTEDRALDAAEQAIWGDDPMADRWALESGLYRQDFWWGNQTGLGVGYALSPTWNLDLNLLHKRDNEGRNTLASLRTQVQPAPEIAPRLALDLELAASDGDSGFGRALYAQLLHAGEALTFDLTAYHADPDFKGFYRDQQYLGLDFGYTPGFGAWTLRGYARQRRYNLDAVDALAAPLDTDLLLGLAHRWESGTGLGIDLRHRTVRDRRATPTFDAVEDAIRLDLSQTLAALDLSLNGSVEVGRRRNRIAGDSFTTLEYRLAAAWQPSADVGLGAYLYYDDDATLREGRDKRMTAGLSARLDLTARLALQLEAESDRRGDHRRQRAGLRLAYRRDNGHLIQFEARHDHGLIEDSNVMLSYSVPIDLAVGRRQDVHRVRGRIFDAETGAGLSNVAIELGERIAVSDAGGYFSFPGVPVHTYELRVAGGSIPVGMIPAVELPRLVDLYLGGPEPVEIPFIRGASIVGSVQLYAPPAGLLPSLTFRGRGRVAASDQVPDGTSLIRTRGLPQVLVTVTDGEHTLSRMTSPAGEFSFVGLAPGRWTLKVATDQLPEGARIGHTAFDLALVPGQQAELEVRAEQPIRAIRMLAPIKVGGA